MSIQKVVPAISKLTRSQIIAIEQAAEHHDVPFDTMRIDAYHEGALIREAAAQYWQPRYDTKLYEILWNVFPQGLLQCLGRGVEGGFPVEVRIVLTYPLNEFWEAQVRIPTNRLGEIFAIAHDMYKHIYDLDDAEWQSEGQDDAPRVAPKVLNRARGQHVWGHDMSDLVFEGVGFHPHPEWPMKDGAYVQLDKANADIPLGIFMFSIGS